MFGRGRAEGPEAPPTKAFETVLGAGCKIEGDVTVRGSILVRGEVAGGIRAQGEIEVDTGAKIKGDVQAERARLGGRIEGNVKVRDSLELRQGSHLIGDVFARSFRIEDGAIFQGNCHMGKETEIPSRDEKLNRETR
ncbi:MAG: polymer-forming cytoskeletal protein [Candidatus Eisenbacteria bacterium]|nr:polymer-forming cytoskeletal protein [Candidatus Latescibacterota bacterium]MBD3302767.1 polymer-forming cytoskeletal protein [Candidatus Eisenbacteria bacterium]